MTGRPRVPAWFWIATVLVALWDAGGLVQAVEQFNLRAHPPAVPTYEERLAIAAPGWLGYVFLVATLAGLLGAVAMLLRERRAFMLFLLSLSAAIILFSYSFGATDVVAHEGFVAAAWMPALVILVALFSIWLARRAIRRGWIGR